MRHFLLASALIGCMGDVPPPPNLTVTSPLRGTSNNVGAITVTGTALPGQTGEAIAKVTVNDTVATLSPDGSFTASITVPDGETVIKTVAMSEYGGVATDARAIRVGELRPVGSLIPHAVHAALSADAFAKLSAAAGPAIKQLNLMQLVGGHLPTEAYSTTGVSANLALTRFAFSDFKVNLAPVDGGLHFTVEVDGIDVGTHVNYTVIGIGDQTDIGVKTDKVTLSGTLQLTAAGTSGFTAAVMAPNLTTTKINLDAGGLTGSVLSLVQDNLQSTIQDQLKSAVEGSLTPLINQAFGALMQPQSFSVLGQTLDLAAQPSQIGFTADGATVTMGLSANLEGSEGSPGYVFTENGTPAIDPTAAGIQVAIADDLVNELLAETHQLGLLDLSLKQDFGYVDQADFVLSLPPMVSADATDGSLRLTLGDMIATFKDKGSEVISAAINAQVDLQVLPGNAPNQVSLKFGEVHLNVNVLGDGDGDSLYGIANAGINVQLDNLGQVMIDVPVPTVLGLSLDNLSLRGDQGYLVMGGDITN